MLLTSRPATDGDITDTLPQYGNGVLSGHPARTLQSDVRVAGYLSCAAGALLLAQAGAAVVYPVLAGRALPLAILHRHRLLADAVADGDFSRGVRSELAPLRCALYWAAFVVGEFQAVSGLKW